MEIKQLEYFQMASRLRSITRASERLKVSQPNVTVSIRKLETELGVKLFDRSQKQLTLTPEGTVFLSRIELALRNIKDAIIEVNDYKQLQRGTIKIGIPPMMGAFLFPKIFSGFRQLYPHLEVFLYDEGSMSIRQLLARDELDFGIVISSNAPANIKVLPLATSQVMACVPANSPLAKKERFTSGDMSHSDAVMLKDGSYIRQLILDRMSQLEVEPNIILESNQIVTLKGLVANGIGVSYMLDFVISDTPGVKAIPLADPVKVEIGLAWKKDRYLSQAGQSFIEFCQSTIVENIGKYKKKKSSK